MYILKFETIEFSDKYRFLIIIYNSVWILVALMLQLYELKQLKRLDRILFNLFKAFSFNILILTAILFSLKASEFSREHLYYTYLILLGLIGSIDLDNLNQSRGYMTALALSLGGWWGAGPGCYSDIYSLMGWKYLEGIQLNISSVTNLLAEYGIVKVCK